MPLSKPERRPSSDARSLYHRRRAHADWAQEGQPGGRPSGRSGRASDQGADERGPGVDPGAVDDVVWGCCDTIGPQAGDIGRTVWLVAGLPQHVPGTTIDRQCGSSQQALHFAAQGRDERDAGPGRRGRQPGDERDPDLGGNVGRAALWLRRPVQHGSPGWVARYGDGMLNQITSAEMIAAKWGLSAARRWKRLRSPRTSAPRLRRTTAGSQAKSRRCAELAEDETIRPGTTLEGLAGLRDRAGRRGHHRRYRQPELRRRGGHAGRLRTRGKGAWAEARARGCITFRSAPTIRSGC